MQRDLINQWVKQSHIKIVKEDGQIIANTRTTKPADMKRQLTGKESNSSSTGERQLQTPSVVEGVEKQIDIPCVNTLIRLLGSGQWLMQALVL